jgi:hypothetical protein
MTYGIAPFNLGMIKAEATEMCFVQYLPVRIPGQAMALPKNLEWVRPILRAATDYWSMEPDDYIYVTAKSIYVTPDNQGNRKGWHSDGFGTKDVNFIWYDCNPTEFCIQDTFELSEDCAESMRQMEEQADPSNIVTYPPTSLLMLDQSVIHRVSEVPYEGMRTFVKISFSKERYNLKGNAHNHLLNYKWEMHERKVERNHPVRCTDFVDA